MSVASTLLSPALDAQVTERVSLGPLGVEADSWSFLPGYGKSISGDGRYVAFMSFADNLVAGDTNNTWDVFVRDRQTGTTERVSVSSTGAEANAGSGLYGIYITDDARFVAFWSSASNLVPNDTNGQSDIFVRDRLLGTTERVNVSSSGAEANDASFCVSITPDGRFVAFLSLASNLVPGDTNGCWDVIVRDRLNGTTELVSSGVGGVPSNADAYDTAVLSADGRFVAFESIASNLVLGDTNGADDVFVRDRQTGTTELVSVDSSGMLGNSDSGQPVITPDGRFVAFTSIASNLVPGDTLGWEDVFVRDRTTSTTECVSLSTAGRFGNQDSGDPWISNDGRFVSFTSGASNLCLGDTNVYYDGFVRDRLSGTTERVTISTTGQQAVSAATESCISADGRYVVFTYYSPGFVQNDNNGSPDVFLRDRYADGFASLCDAGVSGILGCPCSNPPSGLGRGCDNSSATGGASLAASGFAYLSQDSLTFTTSDEKPTATNLLVQADATIPSGVVFGQGVRCAGGSLRRMYAKTAINGSITAPDVSVGDLTISARSAQLGTQIQPCQPYYYFVYYRDPIVLGGCSPSSTFNVTQTGSVAYWP